MTRGRRILLDPGHGGTNSGVTVREWHEKDWTLEMCMRALRMLTKTGVANSVDIVRRADFTVSLVERNRLANHFKADLVLSVHVNAEPTGKSHGMRALFWPGNAVTQRLGDVAAFMAPRKLWSPHAVQAATKKGYPQAHDLLGSYTPSALLLECGFATYPDDLAYLRSDVGMTAICAMIVGVMCHWLS